MSQDQQQPYYQPEQPPVPKRRWPKFAAIGCGALVVLFALIGIIVAVSGGGSSSNTATSGATATTQPTQAPTKALKWATVQTFSGSGSKHTATFTAPDDWKIVWKCDPASFQNIAYNVIIEVDNAADGSMLDMPVNTTCKAGNTTDSSEEHQGGSVFLNVTSEGDWSIQVQELK